MTASVDPGTNLTLSVAAETLAASEYQFIKLIDPTPGSTTPIGTTSNPLKVEERRATTGAFITGVAGTTAITLAAADSSRIALSLLNTHASYNVYLSYGYTVTSTNYNDIIGPGERKDIPSWAAGLAIGAISPSGNATINGATGA